MLGLATVDASLPKKNERRERAQAKTCKEIKIKMLYKIKAFYSYYFPFLLSPSKCIHIHPLEIYYLLQFFFFPCYSFAFEKFSAHLLVNFNWIFSPLLIKISIEYIHENENIFFLLTNLSTRNRINIHVALNTLCSFFEICFKFFYCFPSFQITFFSPCIISCLENISNLLLRDSLKKEKA